MIHASLALGLRASLRAGFWLALLAASASAAAGANLTDLRIGVHGDHTRIVLETDAAAPYIVDANDREVIIHVDAAAAAEAVTAKSPHLIWAKVEPTPIGADVRLQLKQPADVKAMVLTGPHRIVLDLYPKQAASKPLPAAEPLPAPEMLEPEPEPPVTADAEPGLPDEVPPPTPEELAEAEAELPELGSEPEAPARDLEPEAPAMDLEPEAPGEEEAEPEAPAAEPAAPTPAEEPDALADAGQGMEIRVPLPAPGTPPRPAPEPPSGGLFGSPLLLAGTAAVLFALFLYLRQRLRRPATEKYAYPDEPEEEPAAYEPPQRAVPVEPPAGVGESLFDVEADVLNSIPKDEERVPRPPSDDADSEDETQRRISHLERRIEELVDARERLERQVAAQTEELRVQRAAIARTQRVLRTVAPRTDEESSEPVVRG